MVKVLIVDDNKIERESLKECIDWNSVGTELVGDANNGFSAIELLKEHKPDILITDIKMPQINGIELARQAIGICPKIKIIFLTGYEEFDTARNAVNLNAYGYIIKPVAISEFYDIFKKAINASITENLSLQKEKKLIQQLVEILPVLKEKFIRDLLLGIETTDEIKLYEKFGFLGIYIKADTFCHYGGQYR
jgi:Response regulator containing CheY-like receiver domain and AraC-type DNA-binding domain